jgi:hypothetical protein
MEEDSSTFTLFALILGGVILTAAALFNTGMMMSPKQPDASITRVETPPPSSPAPTKLP